MLKLVCFGLAVRLICAKNLFVISKSVFLTMITVIFNDYWMDRDSEKIRAII